MEKRKNSTILFGPTGAQIDRKAWDDLHTQSVDPYVLKEFDNGRMSLQLRATDILYDTAYIPKNFWKMFQVAITNVIITDSEGCPLPEPRRIVDPDTRTFVIREDAEDYYKKFLARFTESKFDEETGELKEIGNTLTPPDPDIPVIAESSPVAGQFGSW